MDSERKNSSQARCFRTNWVNYLDMYGKKFYLTFKGQETFNTSLGAGVTILVCTVFLAYAFYSGSKLILKKDVSTVVNTYSEKIDYDNPEILNFEDYGFDFAVKVFPPMEERYAKLMVEHRRFTQNKNDSKRDLVVTILEMEKCGSNGNLNYTDQEELKTKGIDDYSCLTQEAKMKAFVGGSFYSLDFQEVRVLITSCENSTESEVICASPEEKKEFFKPRRLEFTFIDKYFDLNDLDNSVKQTINDLNFFYLDSEKFIMSRLYLVPTTTQTFHSIFPFTWPNTESFLGHNPLMNQYGDEKYYNNYRLIAYVSIRLSDKKTTYYQTVFTMMDFLSVIGGLFKALFVIGKVFMDLYLSKMFYADVLGSTFQVSTENRSLEEESVRPLLLKSERVLVGDPTSNVSSKKASYISKENLERQMNQEVLNRKRFNFSFKEINSIFCRCFRLCSSDNSHLNQRTKKELLFRKGAKKFISHFDLLSLFSLLQQLRFISNTLLTPEQRFLMKFQRKQVLDSESSDEEDNYWEDAKSLASQNPIQQLKFAQKVDNSIRKFVPKISKQPFDQRLIRKLFLKKDTSLRQPNKRSTMSPSLNMLVKGRGPDLSKSGRQKKDKSSHRFEESKYSMSDHLKKSGRLTSQRKKKKDIHSKRKMNPDASESMRQLDIRASDSS